MTPRLCAVEVSILAYRKDDSAMNADEFLQFTLLVDFHGKFKVPSISVYLSSQMFNSVLLNAAAS